MNGQKAEAIKKKGVQVLQADLADRQSLMEAFKGAYGVYGVTMPMAPNGKIDTELEWEQGKNIVEACLQNKVQHLVLSTVLYVEEGQENTLTYIKRKIDIEHLIKNKNIPYTFLCPGSFMDDFGSVMLLRAWQPTMQNCLILPALILGNLQLWPLKHQTSS
ncbi:MAG: NmrA family NAD(P)-binding protein [Saprospiraceae bacterium]|nr:NmrA family NAD(P)-binding protein [Saprospiraceae bacterium]